MFTIHKVPGELTSFTICNNGARLPTRDFAMTGKLLTILRKLRICDTRADAVFAVLVSLASDAASYVELSVGVVMMHQCEVRRI